MPSIRFSAPACVFDYNAEKDVNGDTPIVDDVEILANLDGLAHDENFSEHLYGALRDAGISGGVLTFFFSKATGQLHGSTEFSLQRPLNTLEADMLMDYTVGQWSDGIGSNFFQMRMDAGLTPQILVPKNAVTIEHFD